MSGKSNEIQTDLLSAVLLICANRLFKLTIWL